ncbi:MAG: restriction endonuclease [Paludibacter sp.]|nr:restriction endonuclease [Paludibacter sp.]
MKRIAGQPEKKYNYLKDLDDKQFPFLIADILFFIFEHTEIRVMDGPGDGKRDIISKNKEGRPSITQCKFHIDFKTSVSSRETDEIVIALMKFNSQIGIFATTGKLSPQAKREFTNDFPKYELSFLEGTDIVDIVLSSPILTSVWINNESIELTSKTLVFPFIIRDIIADKTITELDFNLTKEAKIIKNSVSKEYFHPYRSPNQITFKESGTFIYCNNLIYIGAIKMHEINIISESVFKKIIESIQNQYKLFSLRIGVPFLAKVETDEFKEKLKFEIQPITYVINEGKIYLEKEYVIPNNYPDCIFPNRLGHLEAPWAAWYLNNINTCLQIELMLPYDIQDDVQTLCIKETHLRKLDESLFYAITKEQYNQLESIFDVNDLPNWNCEFGFDGHLIGWLHPFLIDNSSFISFKTDDDRLVLNEDESIENEFRLKTIEVQATLTNFSFKTCTTKKAINISELTNNPLFIEPTSLKYTCAELYHYFDNIPSPVLLKDRTFNFICIWDIPSFELNSKITKLINKQEFDSVYNVSVNFEVRTTHRETNKYGRLDMIYKVSLDISANDFLNRVLSEISLFKDMVEIIIKTKHSDAVLKTEYYWNQEIGIYFNI